MCNKTKHEGFLGGRMSPRDGFILVEMLITVAILGILAAIVLPRYNNIQDTAEASAAGSSMVAIAKAARLHHAKTGEWPSDKSRRVLPPELLEYLPENEFQHAPLGGVWDYEDWRGGGNTAGGDEVGIAVSLVEGDPDLYDDVDKAIDDGDLTTGSVRFCESSPRLVYVLLFD